MNTADETALRFEASSVLALKKENIFSPSEVSLPRVCVYCNVAEYNPNFALHLDRDIYKERTVAFPAVELAMMPPDTIVHGNLDFVTTVGDVFVSEQFVGFWHEQNAPQLRALDSTAPIIEVSDPCVLIARFGSSTWGHWLGELLPRAIAAEAIAPGKYRFVVPMDTTNPDWDAALAQNILGSLRAYGIEGHRLLRIDREHRYRFENLFTVTPMWTYPYAIHPDALDIFKTALKAPLPKAPLYAKSAAMLRIDGTGRSIENSDEILSLLRIKGFGAFDIGNLPFMEQVSIFQEATLLFGVLGSNLTGLLYSPKGVKTLSVAPGDWGDCFFHGLLQAKNGVYADVRGTPNEESKQHMWSPFTLSIRRIAEGLEAIGSGNSA